jgi:4-diphosphocytidyl-2-C-methyl-D-erythritol kinase
MTPAPRVRGALRLRSFAKVNLGLEVLGLRQDGYHELRTIFQSIDLHDDVTLRPRPREVSVTCDHPGVPRDESNLALRAALELRRYARLERGVAIEIRKRIPVAGGLGGGSSNAASVLLGLDRLWRLGLGPAGLHPLARRLGADVPFFLVGGTALGIGRGEEVYPLLRQVRAHLVLVDMQRPVSTAAVFRRIDAGLTPRENSHTIFRFVSRDLEGLSAATALVNDLEPAALQEAPDLAEKVARVRAILMAKGARLAALSGSGSSFFGLFEDAASARRGQAVLVDAGHIAFRSRTLAVPAYRKALWGG